MRLALFAAMLAVHVSANPAEKEVAASYVDRGLVTAYDVSVGSKHSYKIHYLRAGPAPAEAERVLIFCHGAAFTSRTWQITGVLDELALQGFAALAVDLPGFGASDALKTPRLATADHLEVQTARMRARSIQLSVGVFAAFRLPLSPNYAALSIPTRVHANPLPCCVMRR